MNINQAWDLLQKNISNGGREPIASRIDWSHGDCDLWLGLSASGQPFLAIEINDLGFEKDLDLQRFISFDLDVVDRFSKRFIEIKLAQNIFSDHFISFINDIVSHASECSSKKEIPKNIIDRIESWDMFFSRDKNSILPRSELIGLWGELEFLKKMLEVNVEKNKVIINSWQSDVGLDKDFRFKESSVEVKSSMLRKFPRFSITSEIQLENESNKPLYLVGYVFSPDAKNLTNINELINSCRILLKNPKVLAEFELKLLKRGYLKSDERFYEEFRIGLIKKYYFFVGDEFPRIIKSSVCNSISNIRYDLDPQGCLEYLVSEEEVINGIN